MREKQLNTNKSKKLIIGISILFCAVILIIGGTLAFFTQSDTKEIGNIVTENINGTLLFDDNNDYMFGNFIPVNEEDVIKFASKYTDKCKYQEGMYACNLYEFTITNDSNVSQELIFTLDVKENEFSNLYYNLVESSINDINTSITPKSSKVHIDGIGEKEMLNGIVLGPKEHKTYTIIYYVKNINDDQTGLDANKKFYANVRVDSITTGMYAKSIMEAKDCYDYELIEDNAPNREKYGDLLNSVLGTYRLTKFYGISDEGDVNTKCGVIEDNGFYSVTIPSKLKDANGNEIEIGALSNNLFLPIDTVEDEENFNNYSKITNIELEEGIKIIDDGVLGSPSGAFAGVGLKSYGDNNFEAYDVTLVIPSTLISVGDMAFYLSGVKNIIFNKNYNGESNLKNIGYYSFQSVVEKNILIPYSVETIEEGAFAMVKTLMFEGALDGTSKLNVIGRKAFSYNNITTDANNPLIIPYSVNYIGEYAFEANYNLTKLSFAGSPTLITDDNQLTIGESAFYGNGLDYSGNDELELPARISSIGYVAFQGNTNDPIRESLKNIRYMGSRERLNTLGTNWYHTDILTVKAYGEE